LTHARLAPAGQADCKDREAIMTVDFADRQRWTSKRKAALLAVIDAGEMAPEELEHLGLSPEELTTWRRDFSDHGVRGLRVYSLHYLHPGRRRSAKRRRDRQAPSRPG
jgi:hypothetical protein